MTGSGTGRLASEAAPGPRGRALAGHHATHQGLGMSFYNLGVFLIGR